MANEASSLSECDDVIADWRTTGYDFGGGGVRKIAHETAKRKSENRGPRNTPLDGSLSSDAYATGDDRHADVPNREIIV